MEIAAGAHLASPVFLVRSSTLPLSYTTRTKRILTTKHVLPPFNLSSKNSQGRRRGIIRCAESSESTSVVGVPLVGVAVLVAKGRKVLLGKRCTTTYNSTYGLPGGHLEFGESIEECGRRELKEETGLDAGKMEFIMVTNNVFRTEKNPSHYVVIILKAVLDSSQEPQNLEPDKCEGWSWYDWNNLPMPIFSPLEFMVKSGLDPFI